MKDEFFHDLELAFTTIPSGESYSVHELMHATVCM